jgi:lysozyme
MSPAIVPGAKPRLSSTELRRRLDPFGIDRAAHPVVVVGIRGYYRDTLGKPGLNDRGIYDDALFIDTPDATAAFNGNTDPSVIRKGSGRGPKKGIATLKPGAWFVHQFGKHKGQYLALCQRAGLVTVTRDGNPPYDDTGHFGINIHRGSYTGTSSEGCQTIHPSQWDSFIAMTVDQAKRFHGGSWAAVVIPYILLQGQGS